MLCLAPLRFVAAAYIFLDSDSLVNLYSDNVAITSWYGVVWCENRGHHLMVRCGLV